MVALHMAAMSHPTCTRRARYGTSLIPRGHELTTSRALDRVRLVGLDHKLRLLEVCATQFKILEAMPAPNSTDNQSIFDHALHNITLSLAESKADLVRPFPNLVPESHPSVHEPTKIERDIVNAVGNNTMGKLTSLAFGFGRTLRKQAVAVVERANSAQFETISKDALGRYAGLLSAFFAQVQFLGTLCGVFVVPLFNDMSSHLARPFICPTPGFSSLVLRGGASSTSSHWTHVGGNCPP
ncbi:hypothetical protein DYB38_005638 [Aphanomyces astaci]|uniref:Uncharacterized protein n=3 Tax=Aphanomyces astaci TaxID=112090 RepID=A0A397DLH6_APHAT|nr:hypothetical protein DYB38_005638 [Aphanomyces astaci]